MGTTCDVDQALFREAFGSLTWIVLNNMNRRANPIISPVSTGWDTSIDAKWAKGFKPSKHEALGKGYEIGCKWEESSNGIR